LAPALVPQIVSRQKALVVVNRLFSNGQAKSITSVYIIELFA